MKKVLLVVLSVVGLTNAYFQGFYTSGACNPGEIVAYALNTPDCLPKGVGTEFDVRTGCTDTKNAILFTELTSTDGSCSGSDSSEVSTIANGCQGPNLVDCDAAAACPKFFPAAVSYRFGSGTDCNSPAFLSTVQHDSVPTRLTSVGTDVTTLTCLESGQVHVKRCSDVACSTVLQDETVDTDVCHVMSTPGGAQWHSYSCSCDAFLNVAAPTPEPSPVASILPDVVAAQVVFTSEKCGEAEMFGHTYHILAPTADVGEDGVSVMYGCFEDESGRHPARWMSGAMSGVELLSEECKSTPDAGRYMAYQCIDASSLPSICMAGTDYTFVMEYLDYEHCTSGAYPAQAIRAEEVGVCRVDSDLDEETGKVTPGSYIVKRLDDGFTVQVLTYATTDCTGTPTYDDTIRDSDCTPFRDGSGSTFRAWPQKAEAGCTMPAIVEGGWASGPAECEDLLPFFRWDATWGAFVTNMPTLATGEVVEGVTDGVGNPLYFVKEEIAVNLKVPDWGSAC